MVENPEAKQSVPPPEKLLIDDPSNFQFHAAYLTYSELFDKTISPETRKQLNESITTLKDSGGDFAKFYESIDRFRSGDVGQHGFGRAFIKTQKNPEA
jgi:hypothetical protein